MNANLRVLYERQKLKRFYYGNQKKEKGLIYYLKP
jgi:hypothetical protein